MALGIRGLSNSTSTLNADTIQFLNRMGYTARSHLSQYRGGNPVNDSLLGIKYLIDRNISDKYTHTYTPFVSDSTYTAYKNPYALSIAYGVDSMTKDFDLTRYNTYFERYNKLVSYMLGDKNSSDLFVPIETFETTLSSNCTVESSGSQSIYTPIEKNMDASVSYTFTATESAEYYFYTPSRSPVATTLYVNDADFGEYLGKDTNHVVSLGYFEAGEIVEIRVKLKKIRCLWLLAELALTDTIISVRLFPLEASAFCASVFLKQLWIENT
jgi:uncharacterized membrane protein YfhO